MQRWLPAMGSSPGSSLMQSGLPDESHCFLSGLPWLKRCIMSFWWEPNRSSSCLQCAELSLTPSIRAGCSSLLFGRYQPIHVFGRLPGY